jgi:hypothetical protein
VEHSELSSCDWKIVDVFSISRGAACHKVDGDKDCTDWLRWANPMARWQSLLANAQKLEACKASKREGAVTVDGRSKESICEEGVALSKVWVERPGSEDGVPCLGLHALATWAEVRLDTNSSRDAMSKARIAFRAFPGFTIEHLQ